MKKNEKAPTIITAYFDIGRGDYSNEYTRGNNKYIEYFKFWAGMKNNLIIYTQKQFENEIYEIRKNNGLADKTKIIVIDNIYELLPDIYDRMCQIENDKTYFINYRYLKNTPENKAKYCYIMLLKTWCMMDAVSKKYVKDDFIAWLDFGFNHGGMIYTDSNDFNFLWKYSFEEKIYLSGIREDLNKPIFEIIQNGEVYAQGCPYVVPVSLMKIFYDLIINAINSLLDVGFMDDDQTLLLMAYRSRKDIFIYDVNDWCLLLKKYGGAHLKIKEQTSNKKDNLKDKLLYRYRVNKRNRIYLNGLKKIFLKDYLD
jgi:protein YibB